jgi:hypothetical protein
LKEEEVRLSSSNAFRHTRERIESKRKKVPHHYSEVLYVWSCRPRGFFLMPSYFGRGKLQPRVVPTCCRSQGTVRDVTCVLSSKSSFGREVCNLLPARMYPRRRRTAQLLLGRYPRPSHQVVIHEIILHDRPMINIRAR